MAKKEIKHEYISKHDALNLIQKYINQNQKNPDKDMHSAWKVMSMISHMEGKTLEELNKENEK